MTGAAKHPPGDLRILGRKILEVIDPDAAEDYERRRLEDEDARARRRTYFSPRRNGDDATDIRARLSDALASRLLRSLHSRTNPRRDRAGARSGEGQPGNDAVPDGSPSGKPRAGGPQAPDDRRPSDQRMGEAFGAFLEAPDPLRLPIHGGDATTVMVTIDLESLRGQLAELGFVGEEPSAQPRRAGWRARPRSSPPSSTETPRSSTWAVRSASTARPRDAPRRCSTRSARPRAVTFPQPGARLITRVPWARGGSTDLDDLFLLCSLHHHRAHDARVDPRYGGAGVVSFHRRT